MILHQLELLNFKNITSASVEFSSKINCLVGNNGAGKTNVLDSVFYLSFCKSFFNPIDTQHIKHGEKFFMIQGKFLMPGNNQGAISCSVSLDSRKIFKFNKKEYDRLSDHIGLIPSVIISPSDTDLILGGSELRRKYVDSVISQYDKEYLDDLINYNKALQQRNALLKIFAEKKKFDDTSLELWNAQLIPLADRIYKKRQAFIGVFIPLFASYYQFISQGNEQVYLHYESQLTERPLNELFDMSVTRDRALQYTTQGIHKDDFQFLLETYPLKKLGSQGQQKSFIIAMKLAQFDLIKQKKGYKPILLFDDILDKLDYARVEQLMKLVAGDGFGQVFITDTHSLRIADIFREIESETKIFNVVQGHVSLQEHFNIK